MVGFQVRRYRAGDAEAVKEVFTASMSEHVPSGFLHMLRQPLAQVLLAGVACALLTASRSPVLPALALALLLVGGRWLAGYIFSRYIEVCLKKDLGHVQEAYMEREDCCFWVAESEDRVVATVACLPARNQAGCLELKRMAVRRSHRGLGIAKALCRTVADFARQKGYRTVLLYTSVVQKEAQSLYESLGYSRIGEVVIPETVARLLNFTLIEYRYELLGRVDGKRKFAGTDG
ncbi:probable N-acetyltransferase CML1 [Brienomyrus brachyistius]|uniref:probable N-acetyltransferase CML1 n=1 Tax=Brienomyrus brachyistius TaxID=42636 RepID=UPI0020B424E8|nr:probable N-acetyltransferase CML1 [Brienomyrus brachyistius]